MHKLKLIDKAHTLATALLQAPQPSGPSTEERAVCWEVMELYHDNLDAILEVRKNTDSHTHLGDILTIHSRIVYSTDGKTAWYKCLPHVVVELDDGVENYSDDVIAEYLDDEIAEIIQQGRRVEG